MLIVRGRGLWRAAVRVAIRMLVTAACAAAVLAATIPAPAVSINVRWAPGLPDAGREALERRFALASGGLREGTTYQYRLLDPSSANIRALVEHPAVEDTANLNRTAFRPPLRQYRPFVVGASALAAGFTGGVMWTVAPSLIRRSRQPVNVSARAAAAVVGVAPWALVAAALLFVLAAAAGLL
jgi:hypothetical protein